MNTHTRARTHTRANAHTYRFYSTFPSLPFNVQLDPIFLSVLRVFQNAICVFPSNMISVIEVIYLLWPIESRILGLMSVKGIGDAIYENKLG